MIKRTTTDLMPKNIIRLKIYKLVFFYSAILLACGTVSKNGDANYYSEYKFTTESAVMAFDIAKRLLDRESVSEEDWENLFESEGYRNYLIYSNSNSQRKSIRNAIEVVFDPRRQEELDSLIVLPIIMNENYFSLGLIKNFTQLKNNFEEAEEFLQGDFESIIASGDSLARLFLPENAQDSLPGLYDIHFIWSDPDAKVMENAIVFDLNMAFDRGKDDLIKIIAHEFHHNYRALTAKRHKHPLMIQLNKIHQEGVADLIDKDKPPIQKLSLYPKTVIDVYNSDYENTPQKLKNLDSLTNVFLNQEIDSLTFYGRLENYFGFGGHTNGFYMSLRIWENKGIQVLIDSYNDPVEFIKIYNEVARESSNEYVFSSEFIDFIEQIK
jgi:hypothetical protein